MKAIQADPVNPETGNCVIRRVQIPQMNWNKKAHRFAVSISPCG
jgi:hypothetical protein